MKEEGHKAMLEILPKDQMEKVLNQYQCDIEPCFMGFTEQYESLSKIIPLHFTVIDLGCAYNPQCFFFTKHKKYIAVDISDCIKFKSDNCEIFEMSINDFINHHISELNMKETFAICSYVPLKEDDHLYLRESFKNLFIYYPHGGYENPIPQSTNQ